MECRKAKLSQFIFTQLLFDEALSSEIANTLASGFEAKSFAKHNT